MAPYDQPVIKLAHLVEYSDLPEHIRLLPICHTTNLESLRSMLLSGEVRATKTDPEFNESLVFFFYGRARYIPESEVKDTYNPTNPPIALIYDLENLNQYPKRLLPFDSGGFKRFKIDMSLFEFVISLETQYDEIKKFIKQLYSENSNYLNKVLTIDATAFPFCTPLNYLKTLYDDIASWKKLDYGEQAFTMEIQLQGSVPLKPIAAVLPMSMFSSEKAANQMLLAFNINPEEARKKIFLYDDSNTVVFNYKSLIDEVNKTIQHYS